MSKIEVDTIDTQSSTTLQVGSTNTALIKIGTSGDTVEYPAGTTFTQSGTQNVTAGGVINVKSGGNITIDSGATITNNGTASGFSADLTNLNATNLTSGTVPDARFPSVLPAVSGATLTNIAGQLQWQSGIITASTASVGNNLGYWVDTTSNACVITLPGSAAVGDRIILTDYARTWGTNSVTINPNSLKFQGNTTPQPVYNTNGQSVDIVYSGATKGWIPNSDDDVTFETNPAYPSTQLVLAGGGSGGYNPGNAYGSGGGGAGGYRTTASGLTPGAVYTVTVGQGGTSTTTASANGTDSSIIGTGVSITSTGGGRGGHGGNASGSTGGSGGGAGNLVNTGGSLGNTPSTSPSQGNNGGNSGSDPNGPGGGGGGAGANGANATNTAGGNGGAGASSSITGSAVTRGGGGGGATYGGGSAGTGGSGGGGDGQASTGNGSAGTDGLGAGGGGAGANDSSAGKGGDGGNGVVIISMADAKYSGTVTGSPTVATGVSGQTVLTFTGSGSYTA